MANKHFNYKGANFHYSGSLFGGVQIRTISKNDITITNGDEIFSSQFVMKKTVVPYQQGTEKKVLVLEPKKGFINYNLPESLVSNVSKMLKTLSKKSFLAELAKNAQVVGKLPTKTMLGKYEHYPSNPDDSEGVIVASDAQTLVHEFGHYLDYRYNISVSRRQLSLFEDFSTILRKYRTEIKMVIGVDHEYLSDASEIFARAFEMFMGSMGIGRRGDSDLSYDSNEYIPLLSIQKEIIDYFNNLFKISESESMESESKITSENWREFVSAHPEIWDDKEFRKELKGLFAAIGRTHKPYWSEKNQIFRQERSNRDGLYAQAVASWAARQ